MKYFSILAVLLWSASPASATPQTPVKPTEKQQAPAKAADDKAKPSDKDVIREQKPSYPLTTCVVSGHALGKSGDPIDQVVNGRLVRLCCADCVAPATKDAAAVIRKIDEAVVAAQRPTYPMKTCPVTGEALGAGAIPHVYGTRLVVLANADAVAQFDKDPKAAMAKVDKALMDSQIASYPLKTCVVSDEPLAGDPSMVPFDYLYGTTLVRLCCKSCVRPFEKDPAANLKKIAAAK